MNLTRVYVHLIIFEVYKAIFKKTLPPREQVKPKEKKKMEMTKEIYV